MAEGARVRRTGRERELNLQAASRRHRKPSIQAPPPYITAPHELDKTMAASCLRLATTVTTSSTNALPSLRRCTGVRRRLVCSSSSARPTFRCGDSSRLGRYRISSRDGSVARLRSCNGSTTIQREDHATCRMDGAGGRAGRSLQCFSVVRGGLALGQWHWEWCVLVGTRGVSIPFRA